MGRQEIRNSAGPVRPEMTDWLLPNVGQYGLMGAVLYCMGRFLFFSERDNA